MSEKLIIFDFDGTLVDSLEYYLNEAHHYFPNKKSILNKEYVHEHGMKNVFNQLPIPHVLLPIILVYIRIRHHHIIKNLKPHKDIKSILNSLNKNHKIGILSSNSKRTIRVFLSNNNLNDYFSFVDSSPFFFNKDKTLRKLINKHSDEDTRKIYYIGDEQRDIEAANRINNVESIAVTWGSESKKLLKNATPSFIASNPNELLKIINDN